MQSRSYDCDGFIASHPTISMQNHKLFKFDWTYLSYIDNASLIHNLTQTPIRLL